MRAIALIFSASSMLLAVNAIGGELSDRLIMGHFEPIPQAWVPRITTQESSISEKYELSAKPTKEDMLDLVYEWNVIAREGFKSRSYLNPRGVTFEQTLNRAVATYKF